MTLDRELREELAERARRIEPPSDPWGDFLLTRDRRIRRRRRLLVAAAAVILLPVVITGLGEVSQPAREFSAGSPGANVPDGLPDYGAVRGSLGGDGDTVSAVETRARTAEPGHPPFTMSAVVFAGDVQGLRVAIVVGRTAEPESGGDVVRSYSGPAGTPPGELAADRDGPLPDERAVITYTLANRAGTVRALVIPPGDQCTLLRADPPTVGPDGRLLLQWLAVPLTDRTGLVTLTESLYAQRWRTACDGGPSAETDLGTVSGRLAPRDDPPSGVSDAELQAASAGARGSADPAAVRGAVTELEAAFGQVEISRSPLQVLWGGRSGGRPAAAVVAHLSGGGMAVVLASARARVFGVTLRPGDWTDQLIAGAGGVEGPSRIVAILPPGAVRAEATLTVGPPRPLTPDGDVVTGDIAGDIYTDPGGRETLRKVIAYDAAGQPVDEFDLLGLDQF